jgi:hypothetical protein
MKLSSDLYVKMFLVCEDKPKIVRRENAVEFKFPREHVILQDEIDGLDSNKNKRHYR